VGGLHTHLLHCSALPAPKRARTRTLLLLFRGAVRVLPRAIADMAVFRVELVPLAVFCCKW
jgi:hypothetical protein